MEMTRGEIAMITMIAGDMQQTAIRTAVATMIMTMTETINTTVVMIAMITTLSIRFTTIAATAAMEMVSVFKDASNKTRHISAKREM
jgi:hypothetical protein